MSERIGFKAHARLLTMLGEQLIKNERVALVELVKNSYDADATRVDVDFRGFSEDFTPLPGAMIVITDNGVGMTEELVRTAWMNPATPSKALKKMNEPATKLGRVLQGEKGIGRFATFKLGNEVTVVTRARGAADETTLVVDIAMLDEDSDASSDRLRLDYFLDDVAALIDIAAPTVFNGRTAFASMHGTQLSIGGLRAAWNSRLVRGAFEDLDRLQPLMWGDSVRARLKSDFSVTFYRDGRDLRYGTERAEEFETALDRAVLRAVDGAYDADGRTIRFTLDDRAITLDIDHAEVRGLKPFKDHFLRGLPRDALAEPQCGSFGFEFFVFDLTPSAAGQYQLDREQRDMIKDHRIYLYRDGIRVYPYGDAEDDWLEIDIDRGTESAGRSLSNDQTVGYITISQQSNPKLRDKTSREGLLETDSAVDDFKALVKTILRYLRQQYQPYLEAKARSRQKDLKHHQIDRHVEALRRDSRLSPRASKHLDSLEHALEAERELAELQLARTEQLAGVGLSVEAASHDLILASIEALRSARQVVAELKLLDLAGEPVASMASALVLRLEFMASRFKDVQGLFVSTRQKPSEQDVVQLLRRVRSIYGRVHEEAGVTFEIDDGAALRAVSTEAGVLQALINLVDNATFWLTASPHKPKLIRAFTTDTSTLVISDNGPGVSEIDAPFIFEPFYSGKGEDGKGLGLYIARQNGVRHGFEVNLSRLDDSRALAGATFTMKFGEK